MTAMLAFCVCGHTRDEHRAGGACAHVHAAKPKKDWPVAQCACVRFMLDERLTDSEDFIGKVLQKVRSKEGIDMEPVEWQEALQVLRIALWKTSCKYDSRSHIRFRVYAYFELFNDAIDHIRSERGRHGQHRVFDTRRLADQFDDDGDGAAGAGRLDGAASRDPGDDPDNWAADAGGLLAEGDRPALEALRRDGGGDGRRDAAGDPEPVLPARRRSRASGARARGAAAGGGAESRVA